MKLTKDQKVEKAKKLAEGLGKAPHLFFAQFQGVKFVELAELRGRLKPLKCKFSVAKNSTIRHALKGAGIDGADAKLLKGPVGLVVAEGEDVSAAAKVLAAFAKEFPQFKVKAGFVARQWMSPSQCEALSKLPSRQELLGKIVGVVYGVASSAVAVAQAPTRDLLLVVKALSEKKGSQSGAAAA